jgi:hypothetical protein
VRPALPAPKPVKLLSAPKIAGLLPATAQPHVRVSKVESVRKATMPLDDILRQLGPIRSREEMNAEIADMALEALQFLNGLRAAKRRCV